MLHKFAWALSGQMFTSLTQQSSYRGHAVEIREKKHFERKGASNGSACKKNIPQINGWVTITLVILFRQIL
jgi:hypothetical protein